MIGSYFQYIIENKSLLLTTNVVRQKISFVKCTVTYLEASLETKDIICEVFM